MNENDLIIYLDEILKHTGDSAWVDGFLASHSEYREELASLLAMQDQLMSTKQPSPDANSRIRAKNRVMSAIKSAAVTSKPASRPFFSTPGWLTVRMQKLAVTSVVVTSVLFSSGTGLVQASSSSLPGDNLYPVKRSWEGIQLLLVVDPNAKQVLATTFEEERVKEIEELYTENRAESVAFSGTIQKMDQNVWTINSVLVKVDEELSASGLFKVGDMVNVLGTTDDGIIEADSILFAEPGTLPSASAIPLPPGTLNPSMEPTEAFDDGHDSEDGANTDSEYSTPQSDSIQSDHESEDSSRSGDSRSTPEAEPSNDSNDSEKEATQVPQQEHEDTNSGSCSFEEDHCN